MKIRKFTAAATAAAIALALAACSPAADEDEDGGEGSTAGTSVTVGWNQFFYSYNDDSSNGNAAANAIILYMMNGSFNYYNADQELVPDESFGSYEVLSEDPLTVKYTVNDGVDWSDGTPVDAADLMMYWVSQGKHLNTVAPEDVERDPDTNAPTAGGEVFFDGASSDYDLATQTPEVGDDGKSLTLVFDEPFADWEAALDRVGVPAHVTTMQALGIEDPQEAKDAFLAAVAEEDGEVLAQIADFWNSGYDFTALPDDESLYISNGAYLMTDLVENQYVTLKANEDYSGDRAANIETVTVRWNEDPLAQVQALENGELDLFGPQATTDVLQAVEAIDGVEVETGVEGTYEHVDLVFDNGGPFDPATYDGDEETALKVRQAFLHAVPRQEVIDKLITPLNPDAEVRNSFIITPGAPGYDEMVEQNGMVDTYAEQDLERAQELLAEAGVETPVDVRMMFAEGNVRRENEFAIYQPALQEAGFNLIDRRNVNWGPKLGDGTYDAVFFGWQSTSTAVTESEATYATGGGNNLIGYSNEEVDELFGRLKVSTDPDEQLEIQIEIEKHLVADAIGITVFQFPAVAAWNSSRITNVEPAPLSPTIFHGFWNWEVPS